jgi:SlyX protein
VSEDENEARELRSRVVELEVKMGFAEDLLDELNRQVFRQQEQIEALRRQLIDLHQQVQSPAGAASIGPGDEIPPHY